MLILSLTLFVGSTFSIPLGSHQESSALASISAGEWQNLNQTVGGRLFAATPLAKPCYSTYNGHPNAPDQARCSQIGAGYQDESFITSNFAGYTWVCSNQTHVQECGTDTGIYEY